MHLLTRISLQNWYLIDALDIEVRGASALVGPTGAGKSSIQDAIQTVITGANQNRLHLNPSASGRSSRSVLEYCLGMTRDPSEGGKPLRSSCETVIALVFRDEETNEPITVGIAMSAREGDSREEVLSRFIVPGLAYSVDVARRRDGTIERLASWAEISGHLRERHPQMEEYRSSAEKFTADMLKAMRGGANAPNVKHFLRSFSNALAFKPIFDPTAFVRDYVLEPDNLDIARVKTSIDTWQELETIIEDVEARLRRVIRAEGRFRNWGRARAKAEAARLHAAIAETRRLAVEVMTNGEVLQARRSDLLTERQALQNRRQWLRELDEDIAAKRALASTGGGAAALRQIEIETTLAERDREEAVKRYGQLRNAFSAIASLAPVAEHLSPTGLRALEAARDAFHMMPETGAPQEAMRAKGDQINALFDQVLAMEGSELLLEEKADLAAAQLREMQSRYEAIEQRLSRGGGSGRSVLSDATTRLMRDLSRKGIAPVPLCDVVEIVDEKWQYAVESLLGRAREALIVDPSEIHAAFDIMWRDRDAFAGCTLVKTNATANVKRTPPAGSILEAVSTDNEHAAAFMAVRIGSFLKAETEGDLARMDRGVMPNGKTSSAMGLSVQRNLRELLFGRSAREKTGEALRNEADDLRGRLMDLRGSTRLLREAARILPAAIGTLRSGLSPHELEHALQQTAMRLSRLNEDRDAGSDANALADEIRDLEEDRKAYSDELHEEIEPEVERLQGELATAQAKFERAKDDLRSALRARRKVYQALEEADFGRLRSLDPEADIATAESVCLQVRNALKNGEAERKDRKAWLSSVRNDYRAIAENAEGEARREQAAAIREISEYGANWQVETPIVDADNMLASYAWVTGERTRLEGNELREHREACARAATEMRRMLKEDLLARLAEKLSKVEHRMETLNSFLSRHRFTGQTYSFTWNVDERFARMYHLAMKVGGSTEGEPLNLDDAEVAEAVSELENMIDAGDGAATLADYREYFVFEIIMTDQAGGRTSMSSRAIKGSGGEAQAPFYVAIAASLASAYFPGHQGGRPQGMGLALFDEAFNKLDVPNTQALLSFFQDMGLQLMIAGPEDKRATFTEVLDTIVLVNKALDGKSVYVDAEYPGEMARKALGDINPDHMGIQAFTEAL